MGRQEGCLDLAPGACLGTQGEGHNIAFQKSRSCGQVHYRQSADPDGMKEWGQAEEQEAGCADHSVNCFLKMIELRHIV